MDDREGWEHARQLGELSAQVRQLAEGAAERHAENTARIAVMEGELAGVRRPLDQLLQVRQVLLWTGWLVTTTAGIASWVTDHFHLRLYSALAALVSG